MDRAKSYIHQGELALKAGDIQAALHLFDAAVSMSKGTNPFALFHLGSALGEAGMNGAAMNLLMRAIDESPKGSKWLPNAWVNLGVAFRRDAHDGQAMHCYEEALKLRPKDAVAYANWSGCHVNKGNPDPGIELADKSLEIDPFNSQAGHHKGLLLLEKGDWERGWRWYQHRMRLPEFHNRDFGCPMWEGQHVDTLIIHGEQGIGDEIMFASLIHEVQKRVGKVVIECAERLIPIFERSFGVKCYKDEKTLKENAAGDAFIAMGSIPWVLGINEPLKHGGYLKPDPERLTYWKAQGPKIGISWRGGTKKTHEHLRNFIIEEWKPLILNGFKWVSVQYSAPEYEVGFLGIENPETKDFDDHLALVASCDLVISVCNTTIHEAGATNTPCWCLVPNQPAWRYGMTGEQMLFYPSVKLIRQGADENWPSVIERIKVDLAGISLRAREAA